MNQPIPTNNEVFFDGGIMITETDLEGRITYANRKFLSITGYTRNELINKPHSIIRHPDMPKVIFDNMWDTLKRGFPWEGYVKNLTKDGSFYWVHVFVTPRYDKFNKLNGYIASREIPNEKNLKEVEKEYSFLLKEEISFQNTQLAA
jgi:aerotaxis receptor